MRLVRSGLLTLMVAASVGGCDEEDFASWVDQFGTAQNDSCMGVSAYGPHLYAYGRTGGALPGQTNLGGQDVYLRKYDSQGNEIWTRQFGTSGADDCLWGNVEAGHGQVIVAGTVTGALPGESWMGGLDVFLRAYDTDGNVLWTRQFGTALADHVRNVALDGRGDIYIAGHTDGILPGQASAGGRDAYVRKFDADGNLVWTFQFGSPGVDEAIGITIHGKYVFATGVTENTLPGQTSNGGTDGLVIKMEAKEGAVEWLRQVGTAGQDSPWKVRVIGGGIFIGGHTSGHWGGTNLGSTDPFLARLDMEGDLEWIRQFGTPGMDLCFSMTAHEGGIAMAGSVRGALPGQEYGGDADFFVRQYDADGGELWTLQWGSSVLDALTAITARGSDLFVSGASAASLSGHTNAGLNDAVVVRIAMEDGQLEEELLANP